MRFGVSAFAGANFYGTVIQIQYITQVVNGEVTYPVIIEVKNPEMKLKPGMTASVTVAEAKSILKVPNQALEPGDQENTAFVRVKDRFGVYRVLIETGEKDQQFTEVKSGGLKEMQLVVVGERRFRKNGPLK